MKDFFTCQHNIKKSLWLQKIYVYMYIVLPNYKNV